MFKKLTSCISDDAAEVISEFADAGGAARPTYSDTRVRALLEPGHEVLWASEALKEVDTLHTNPFPLLLLRYCYCTGPLSWLNSQ